ncbi:hypothetical protein ACFOON_15150 [Novosphingobium piscinae]|uniref:Uncharacterized protein n=1 Tax=Novosphingobium piscinae TaxID=1507448 RepID=A0A7X1FXH8_9SPHN|nr:hypothetical protein [Novosphingobium piscinae]MBC2668763.1 hypothetical protein [Novosphingobium piscinae]
MADEKPTHAQIYEALGKLDVRMAQTDERLDAGSNRFVEIKKALDEIAEAVKPIPQMQADIAATKEIVEAWGAIKTFGKFIKWFGGIIVALTAIGASIFAALKFAVHIGK